MEIRLDGEIAAVTGGAGVLPSAMSKALAEAGAAVAVLDLREEAARAVAAEIVARGGRALAVGCDVVDVQSLEAARARIERELGPVSILVNGAGGNRKDATVTQEVDFFDLPAQAIRGVFELNFLGTLLPCQVFGRSMAARKKGCIVNISSMCCYRPLTRVVAYSAAKAAVSNFTQWLAVHMSREYSPEIRVNAIAPGFFLTEQNRYLLLEPSGELTERGRQIIAHTPLGRFGKDSDLLGALLWLVSPYASFVHGAVIPIDGGFSAYSGV